MFLELPDAVMGPVGPIDAVRMSIADSGNEEVRCVREERIQTKKALDATNRLIARPKAEIASLKQELSEYKSVRSKLHTSDLECENTEFTEKSNAMRT